MQGTDEGGKTKQNLLGHILGFRLHKTQKPNFLAQITFSLHFRISPTFSLQFPYIFSTFSLHFPYMFRQFENVGFLCFVFSGPWVFPLRKKEHQIKEHVLYASCGGCLRPTEDHDESFGRRSGAIGRQTDPMVRVCVFGASCSLGVCFFVVFVGGGASVPTSSVPT